jgi:plasmid stabilization system protein ParE
MSLLTVEIHPEALQEAQAARDWYEARSAHAAAAFLTELDVAVARILAAPELYPPYLRGTRCYVMRRFPYLVVYRVVGMAIQVVAVAHGRRRPGYWKTRIPR